MYILPLVLILYVVRCLPKLEINGLLVLKLIPYHIISGLKSIPYSGGISLSCSIQKVTPPPAPRPPPPPQHTHTRAHFLGMCLGLPIFLKSKGNKTDSFFSTHLRTECSIKRVTVQWSVQSLSHIDNSNSNNSKFSIIQNQFEVPT